MGQTWENLLFAHWRVDSEALRRVVPAQIPLDTFDGSAWLAITPFHVTGMRARLVPPVPGVARFPEINVRTYATIDGRPGIYFLSLDTPNRLAVATARRVYRLPYFRAKSRIRAAGEAVHYSTVRAGDTAPAAAAAIRYRPDGPAREALPGSFEHWATERYCLYTLDDDRRVLRGDIHHRPWRLQPAVAAFDHNSMSEQIGVALGEQEPTLHFARRQDVVFWLNRPIHGTRLRAACSAPSR